MIKAIIIDVDGVLVGEKIGYNSPHPHPEVLQKLKRIRAQGIPIALCTAKPHYAIPEIIRVADLHNPHITDAGAVIYDPIDDVLVEQHIINKTLAKKIVLTCLTNDVYTEIYTVEDYYIQQSQFSGITEKHTHILQKEPVQLSSLIEAIDTYDITKIMPIASDDAHKKWFAELLDVYNHDLSITWGVHPIALPLQFCIITAKGSGKKEGAEAIVKNLGLSFADVLGIGDSTSDWNFMELCSYTGTLANGSAELKKLVASKGEGKYCIGKSVDENGILDILHYFF